jgi:hypothetical protein
MRARSARATASRCSLDTDSSLAAEVLPRFAADGVPDVGETVLGLAQFSNIVGLKDATGDIERGISLMRSLPKVARSTAAMTRPPRL